MATLLIVDDYPPVLCALALLFEGLEHRILTAYSGGEALQVLAEVDVALIVTDERMGDMPGSQLAHRVRAGARNRDTPILLLSGADPADEGIRSATALFGVTFVSKPVDGPWLRRRAAELACGARELPGRAPPIRR